MPKFDLNNSRYAKLFSSSDVRFLQTYVDDIALFRTNYGFWTENFQPASNMTPTAASGEASFTVKARPSQAAPLMDLRDKLGDSNQMDEAGISFYTGTIPDFISRGFKETALERNYKENLFSEFGNDRDIVLQWTANAQLQIDSANSTLSNMAAQLLSTGKIIWNYGSGIYKPIQKAEIPTGNFRKAGTKVWSDPDCNILAQMVDIEKKYRDDSGYLLPMKWQIPYDIFYNVLLKNAEVKAWVKDYRYHASLPWETNAPVTEDVFRTAIVSYPGLSPIEIIVEKQTNLTNSGSSVVHGWADGIVVLRPQGLAGEIEYADLLDAQLFKKYGSSNIQKTFASFYNGIYSLVNTTLNNGTYKEWHTDVAMCAVPALTEFPDHVIIDTTVAD